MRGVLVLVTLQMVSEEAEEVRRKVLAFTYCAMPTVCPLGRHLGAYYMDDLEELSCMDIDSLGGFNGSP